MDSLDAEGFPHNIIEDDGAHIHNLILGNGLAVQEVLLEVIVVALHGAVLHVGDQSSESTT